MSLLSSFNRGDWWLRSKSDSRWNCDGRDYVDGLVMPYECKQKIQELKG